jgi:hypothetical protein
MRRFISRLLQSPEPSHGTDRARAKTRRRRLQLELLEKREVFAGNPILMLGGDAHSQPQYGSANPNKDLVYTYNSGGISGRDAFGNKIDFNKDGYGDTLQTGRVDEVIDYGAADPLTACSRTSFAVVDLGGPSGGMTQVRDSGALACGGFAHNGSMVEATAIDLNRDGYQDIFGMSLNTTGIATLRVSYWDPLKNKFGSVQNIGSIQAKSVNFASWQFGDVNGDQVLDIVTPKFDPALVANGVVPYVGFDIFLGVANSSGYFGGKFQAAAWSSVTARTAVADWGFDNANLDVARANPSITPVLKDLNGDGKIDLAIPEIDGMSVFTNSGDGKFSGPRAFTAVPSGTLGGPQLKAGDFNNDGKPDIIDSPNLARATMLKKVSASTWDWQPASGSITLFENASTQGGAMNFGSQAVVGFNGSAGYNGQFEIADFNHDGSLDLAVADASQDTLFYGTLQGNGDGTFGTMTLHTGYKNDDILTGSKFSRGIQGITAVDVNNDGQIDIVSLGVSHGTNNKGENEAVSIIGVSLNQTYANPKVTTATPPAATQGQPYSFQLVHSGGNPNEPFTFTLDPNSTPLPTGLTMSASGLITGTPTQSGPFQLLVRVSQPSGIAGTTLVALTVNPGNTTVSTPILVVAPEIGGEPVRVLNPDGTLVAAIDAFFGYRGPIRVASGDITGDGYADVIAICGSGITTEVRVFDGVTHARVLEFAPYGQKFKNGGYVAVGDVIPSNPGFEIIVSPAYGREQVRVFTANGTLLSSFVPYTNRYSGSVPLAVGNIDGTAGDEIIVAIGSGRSEVRWFDGAGNLHGKMRGYGNQIAVGDVDGDGRADVVLTSIARNKPIVRVYDPKFGLLTREFAGYDPKYRGGLRVALLRRADGSRYDIVTALEAKRPTDVMIHDGQTGALLDSYLAYPSVFAFGLNIAGG